MVTLYPRITDYTTVYHLTLLPDKYSFLLYTYRNLRAKKHPDKNSLFALEKPADWSYDFFH